MSWALDRLRSAGEAFDWAAVDQSASDYVAHLRAQALPAIADEYEPVLELLRGYRRYDALVRVIDELFGQGVKDPVLLRHFAQAQIEQGYPAAALATLGSVTSDPETESQWLEARGLVGRCHKELCLRTKDLGRREAHWQLAVSAYLDMYREDPSRYWSGINAVALLASADSLGVDPAEPRRPAEESRRVAAAVLETVRDLPPGDAWAQATAVEALVALGEVRGAEQQVEGFLRAQPDAFAVNSLVRQLTQVWGLDNGTPPGSTLLPQLRSELLRKTGGVVSLAGAELGTERLEGLSTSRQFEKVLGTDRYQTLNWYVKGLARCRAVARIETENEDGVGTGFLVRGKDLSSSLPEFVLMTNGHVVPEALDVEEAFVAFHATSGDDSGPQRFRAIRQWWYRPSQYPELDTTLLELDGRPDDVTPVPIASRMPDLRADARPRAYVIGHPRGLEQPQFSLQDNHILGYDATRLHYRSPTEGGSSGSPVFDRQWNLIGLHHAGSLEMRRLDGPGLYAANEGIRLSAIISALGRETVTPAGLRPGP